MYGKWISLRVKKFSESYFIKPEHMHDLDELVGYGALEKTVFPYSDTTKSAFNTLLNRLPKKDAVGGYKDLLLSGCIYCYYSKKQETYVVVYGKFKMILHGKNLNILQDLKAHFQQLISLYGKMI